MELDITRDSDGETCTLVLAGEVDVYTSPDLRRALADAVESGCAHVVVDLEHLSFIDSSGLGVLVSTLRRMKEDGGTLRLVCTKEGILKIFRITGLDKVFPIFSSAEEPRDF
jgi:anti-sigma B factor antagonist